MTSAAVAMATQGTELNSTSEGLFNNKLFNNPLVWGFLIAWCRIFKFCKRKKFIFIFFF